MIPSPFKKIQKRLSKSFHSAGSFISSVGATPSKQLRVAIMEGDEQKAISLYTAEQNGKSLQQEMHPSQPFQSSKAVEQTPLHLAALTGLAAIMRLFLERGGNPEEANGLDQTSLHCLCMRGDGPEQRLAMLETLLAWRGEDPLFGEIRVSVNHVDTDGNIALHYAARSGLVACVVRLLQQRSIISLVNKDQMTCCDEADANEHIALADMLEAALVFQPAEEDLGGVDLDEGPEGAADSLAPAESLVLDCQSMETADLYDWAQRSISLFVEVTNIPVGRVLAILGGYDWNVSRALQEYVMNPDSALKSAHLKSPETADPTITAAAPASGGSAGGTARKRLDFELGESSDEALEQGGMREEDRENPEIVMGEKTGAPSPSPTLALCPICCEPLRPAIAAEEALRTVSEPKGEEVMCRALPCQAGHVFCIQCWASHSTVQILEMGAGVLQCPGYKCNECVDDAWAPVMFSSSADVEVVRNDPGQQHVDMLKKMKDNKVRRIVDRNPSLMWCPVADCGCIVIVPKKIESLLGDDVEASEREGDRRLPSSAICGRGHAFCTACNEAAHSPCSCSSWMKWQLKVQSAMETAGTSSDGSDLANALWVAANTKRCPKCKLPIEKNEGCNHMSCRKCRYEFCWVCMQDWSLHSQNTGGYFQCNRFVASGEDAGGAGGYDDDEEHLAGMFGEVGSSRREDMLARRAGMRMERFLHHFTRFHSHDESYTMESKMHMETLERLCGVLISSLEDSTQCGPSAPHNLPAGPKSEKLMWLQEDVANPFSEVTAGGSEVSSSGGGDRQLIEELRLLRHHQKQLLVEKGVANETPKSGKSPGEGKSWLAYVRESIYSKGGKDTPKTPVETPPETAEVEADVDERKPGAEDNVHLVPSILLFAAKGDILDSGMTDFCDSFGVADGLDTTQSMVGRLQGLDFLQRGFRELLKCRQILKGSFAFAYYYFSGDDDGHMQSYGREMAMQTRKLLFEQGQADLNARTETLSDVVARRRLRASRAIIGQATRSARIARLAFERTLSTCASEIDDMGEARQSARARRHSSSQNLRRRTRGMHSSAAPPPARRAAEEDVSLRPPQSSHRVRAVAQAAVATPPPAPNLGSTAGTGERRGPDFSAEYLDQQLKMILQSLDGVSSTTGADAESAPPVPSPTRGSMGPPWSPGRSTTLQPARAEEGAPTPKSSRSPVRESHSNSLLRHPDRGLIEALQSDGVDDDQIKAILGIEDDAGSGNNDEKAFFEQGRQPTMAGVSAHATGVARAENMVPDKVTTVAGHEDGEPDMNMAILLSIQDPRLNDLTLRGEAVAASASEESRDGNPRSVGEEEQYNENVTVLQNMGFSKVHALQALIESSNDVEVAIHSLLRNT